MASLEGLYHAVMRAAAAAAGRGLPSSFIDEQGKRYLEGTKLKDRRGRLRTPREPYTFIHNTGCSECQEGFGAVTPYSGEPLGTNVGLMIDAALMGFDEEKRLVFPIEYAVIEDAFWKKGRRIGVYNRMPMNVQDLVGHNFSDIPAGKVHKYHRPL